MWKDPHLINDGILLQAFPALADLFKCQAEKTSHEDAVFHILTGDRDRPKNDGVI